MITRNLRLRVAGSMLRGNEEDCSLHGTIREIFPFRRAIPLLPAYR